MSYKSTHTKEQTTPERIGELEARIKYLEAENAALKSGSPSEAESKYRSLFEMSDDAILVIEDNTFVDCNQAVVRMLGYQTKKELLDTHPSELSPTHQPDGRLSYEKAQEMMQLALKNGSHHFEWIHTKANGENFPVEVWLSRVEHLDKIIINTVWRDLTQKKKAERIIQKNLEEKEILLKEIHHRVKNNLQIISSLLNLQLDMVDSPEVYSLLRSCKNRILSMSKVHEMLYQSKDLSKINYRSYVEALTENLVQSIKGPDCKLKIEIEISDLYLNISTAVPLGLLINEIVSNALKHGIKDVDNGHVRIAIREHSGDTLEMEISDNGVGYQGNHLVNVTPTLGFQLMNSLTEQLNGQLLKDETKPGTHYRLVFERQ